MNRIRPRSFGFAFAAFLAAWHTAWALLVWIGAAQRLLDFVFRLHMITPPYQVTAFSPITAAALISMTAVIGYISGWFIGVVWNFFTLGLPSARRLDTTSRLALIDRPRVVGTRSRSIIYWAGRQSSKGS